MNSIFPMMIHKLYIFSISNSQISEFIDQQNISLDNLMDSPIIEPLRLVNFSISDLKIENKFSNQNGGGFRLKSPSYSLYLNNTLFSKNGVIGNGGAIYIDYPVYLILDNITFEDNNATSSGGSVFSTASQSIIINNSTSKNSKANSNGGSFSLSAGFVSMDEIVVNQSYSGGAGGTIYSTSSSQALLNEIDIQNSYSVSHGGSFYLQTSNNNSISKLKTINSSSSGSGGTGYLNSPYSIITSSYIKDSFSTSTGGAFYISTSSTNKHEVTNCYFENCRSNSQGGALFFSVTSISNVTIFESTFNQCSSKGHGGVIYVYSNNLNLNIKKVCISFGFIDSTSSSFYGSAIYISGNNNLYQQNMEFISCHSCGQTSYSMGVIYQLYGQQLINGLNLSSNRAYQSSIGYFRPYLSSNYQYSNFIKCLSNSNDALYLYGASNLIYFNYCNVINNDGNLYCLYYYCTSNVERLHIRFCIFLNNLASSYLLYSYGGYLQRIVSSYILYSKSPWFYGFTNDNNIFSTTLLTPTHQITHYSTHICLTPFELGSLDTPYVNCQTLPPLQTTCYYQTNDEQISLSSITTMFNLIKLTLLLLFK